MDDAPDNQVLKNVSIIICAVPDEKAQEVLLQDLHDCGAEILVSGEGARARSLNVAAGQTQNEFLWFLQADSRVTQDNIEILARCLKRAPDALHYFLLSFGMCHPGLNAWAGNVRSLLFGLPNGDQGLCISKAQFEKVGGFPEHDFGEALLFVRKAKKHGVSVQVVPSRLCASPMEYYDIGWLKLTLIRHAQFWRLMFKKI